MNRSAYVPYDPLNVPKPFATDVWIVDGPEIRMRCLGAALSFPTRATIVRLPSGALWVHSPIALTEGLATAVRALGPVRHLVAPNTFHDTYLTEWRRRFPAARTYGAPGLAEKAKHPLVTDETLTACAPAAWEAAFEQCVVPGRILTEVDFFHRASKTLVLTDLIENFEPRRVRRRLLRSVMRASGAADPDGKAPVDMRLSFIGYRAQVRAAVEQMLRWEPERIVISHGRPYTRDGAAELRRAFRWVL